MQSKALDRVGIGANLRAEALLVVVEWVGFSYGNRSTTTQWCELRRPRMEDGVTELGSRLHELTCL